MSSSAELNDDRWSSSADFSPVVEISLFFNLSSIPLSISTCRCSILNCEVVLELLSSKLQEPSSTVQMVTSLILIFLNALDPRSNCCSCTMQRVLCAVSCLLTSDLLSLEQMFGATQRRLRQLCGGPPGPVANKATKVGMLLDQFSLRIQKLNKLHTNGLWQVRTIVPCDSLPSQLGVR